MPSGRTRFLLLSALMLVPVGCGPSPASSTSRGGLTTSSTTSGATSGSTSGTRGGSTSSTTASSTSTSSTSTSGSSTSSTSTSSSSTSSTSSSSSGSTSAGSSSSSTSSTTGSSGTSGTSSTTSSSGASTGSSTGGSTGSSGAAIHFIGRFDTSDPAGPRFAWPGSAIAAHFTGTSLTLALADSGTNFWAVSIDGAAPTTLATSSAQTSYLVAQNLPDTEHALWIEKLTESFVGTAQFLGLSTDPGRGLVPSPEPFTRRIELIGDSITCGYGVLGVGPSCPFTDATEDEYLAYGAIAARALGAEHVGISYSGIGVYRDYNGDTVEVMPAKYSRIFADDPTSVWDFSWVPDVVVIDLGTNDFAHGDPGQAYVTAYTRFVAQVRSHYPSADVILAVGTMLTEPNHSTALGYAQSVASARHAAGDARVSVLDLGVQLASDGYGCDGHPSATTQAKMAAALEQAIRQLTGW